MPLSLPWAIPRVKAGAGLDMAIPSLGRNGVRFPSDCCCYCVYVDVGSEIKFWDHGRADGWSWVDLNLEDQ
jgi:hypothetical protein